jgi:hypothetical protein
MMCDRTTSIKFVGSDEFSPPKIGRTSVLTAKTDNGDFSEQKQTED